MNTTGNASTGRAKGGPRDRSMTGDERSGLVFFFDLAESISRPAMWLYSTWIAFLIKYRRTLLGPIWIIIAPAIFVVVLGRLFAAVSGAPVEKFIPHLTIGLVLWNFVVTSISGGSKLFFRSRAQLMQGKVRHSDIILRSVTDGLIGLAHQAVVIIGVLIYYRVPVSAEMLLVIPGLLILALHAIWTTTVFAIVGARFSDVSEMSQILMRIAFLATPIIWMVHANGGRGRILGVYANFNPFYHAIEVVRAPLIGDHPTTITWLVNGALLVVGFSLAAYLYGKYRRMIAIWV